MSEEIWEGEEKIEEVQGYFKIGLAYEGYFYEQGTQKSISQEWYMLLMVKFFKEVCQNIYILTQGIKMHISFLKVYNVNIFGPIQTYFISCVQSTGFCLSSSTKHKLSGSVQTFSEGLEFSYFLLDLDVLQSIRNI